MIDNCDCAWRQDLPNSALRIRQWCALLQSTGWASESPPLPPAPSMFLPHPSVSRPLRFDSTPSQVLRGKASNPCAGRAGKRKLPPAPKADALRRASRQESLGAPRAQDSDCAPMPRAAWRRATRQAPLPGAKLGVFQAPPASPRRARRRPHRHAAQPVRHACHGTVRWQQSTDYASPPQAQARTRRRWLEPLRTVPQGRLAPGRSTCGRVRQFRAGSSPN